jgi:formate-dependent nitrite reductase cytochrome c552 subunit
MIKSHSMGSRNIKTIKGKEYLYYIVSEDGVKRAIYCGLASSKDAEQKALKLELEQLKEQKKNLSEKMIEIENKLRK